MTCLIFVQKENYLNVPFPGYLLRIRDQRITHLLRRILRLMLAVAYDYFLFSHGAPLKIFSFLLFVIMLYVFRV